MANLKKSGGNTSPAAKGNAEKPPKTKAVIRETDHSGIADEQMGAITLRCGVLVVALALATFYFGGFTLGSFVFLGLCVFSIYRTWDRETDAVHEYWAVVEDEDNECMRPFESWWDDGEHSYEHTDHIPLTKAVDIVIDCYGGPEVVRRLYAEGQDYIIREDIAEVLGRRGWLVPNAVEEAVTPVPSTFLLNLFAFGAGYKLARMMRR